MSGIPQNGDIIAAGGTGSHIRDLFLERSAASPVCRIASKGRSGMGRKASLEFTLNELVVLGLLHEREMYGLEIVKAAAASTSASQASVGTVYPLLKDLVREGWLSCRRTGGTPRTYYRLTEQGKAQLPLIAAQWEHVHDSVNALLGVTPIAAAENPVAAPEH
jgi:PadR family transcriptional regulator PadR